MKLSSSSYRFDQKTVASKKPCKKKYFNSIAETKTNWMNGNKTDVAKPDEEPLKTESTSSQEAGFYLGSDSDFSDTESDNLD